MKRNLFFILLLAMAANAFAQKPSAQSISKRLTLGFGVNQDFWMKVPDSINSRSVNQGIDVFINYMFPMDKKGYVSFFIGGGIGAHNFYSKALLGVGPYNIYNKTFDNVGATESFFYNVPSKLNGDDIKVKLSKLSITYFDVPFGFQFKTKSKVHATLGFKVGWKLNAHTKYKGTDLEGSGFTVKEKSGLIRNIDNFHYGPYGVLGYKWFGLSAFYQLSSTFEKDLGPEIYPISIGIVFKPYK